MCCCIALFRTHGIWYETQFNFFVILGSLPDSSADSVKDSACAADSSPGKTNEAPKELLKPPTPPKKVSDDADAVAKAGETNSIADATKSPAKQPAVPKSTDSGGPVKTAVGPPPCADQMDDNEDDELLKRMEAIEKGVDLDAVKEVAHRKYLSKFLFSYEGGRYQMNIKFATKLKCGQPAPNITVTTMDFKFRPFKEREEYLPAKYAVEDVLASSNISTGDHYRTLWAKIFGNWVTDEIIDTEIYRNISLALIGVMFCSVVLIVNLQICFWIFVCVLLTLVNVGGLMQVWGLTLDLVSCIALQLAVGLCVDYAAHIGHTFLTINKGDRNRRSLETVLHIGAAVFYGGGSTILSLSILSGSQAYTYRTFFKIFLLVIAYGLFHGTILLPVILSLIAPAPYSGSLNSLNTINNNPSPTKKVCREGTEMISFIGKEKYTPNGTEL